MAWTVYEGGEQVDFTMPAWGWPLILVNILILLPISFLVGFPLAIEIDIIEIDIMSTNLDVPVGQLHFVPHLPCLHHY